MRLITVRTITVATLCALAGIATAVTLVKVGTAPEVSPGTEASPGTLTGRVTDVATEIALENAVVLLEDAGIGAVTNPNGRFMIANVPAGKHTLTIRNLGYAEQEQEVTVVEGQMTVADLEMRMEVIKLEGLIISVAPPGKE